MPMRFGVRRIPAMEEIVRPWVDVLSYAQPREVPVITEEPEAFLRWGQPSNFLFDENTFRNKALDFPGFRVNDPGEGEDDIIEFTEIGRDTTVVRISNEQDPGQFVDVERIDKILFQSKGQRYSFRLNNG